MNAFLAYVLAHTGWGALLSATLALLALVLPPMILVAGALSALFTLRRGPTAGLVVSVGGGAIFALGVILLGGDPALTVGLLLFYLPLWGLAWVLRVTLALHLTLEVLLWLGIASIGLAYLMLGDPAQLWMQVLTEFAKLDSASSQMLAKMPPTAQQDLAQNLTGALVTFWAGGLLLSLLSARAWQAQLYNPGGFGTEFRALRLSWRLRGLVLLVLLGLMLPSAWQVISANVLLLLTLGFGVQGVAVIHALLPRHPQRLLMLVAIYGLVLFLPQGLWFLASLGYFDSWLDWRARLRDSA